jgi:hypothetical protein
MKREQARVSRRHRHLVDCMMDAYVDWREECAALEDAYDRWANADASDAELACAAYGAGLDREERASTRYAELVRGVNEELPESLRPEAALAASIPRV